MRIAVLTTHPVQYYAPLFSELARRVDLHVLYAHRATAADQAAAGFGTAFNWDVDLLSGYSHTFLTNVARDPSPSRFSGCDTPAVGELLVKGHFNAVLTLGWHVKSLLQGVWAAKRLGLPVMVRGDSQLGQQPKLAKRVVKRLFYPRLLRVFDAALVVGTRNREFLRHYQYPEAQMFASPHAVDTDFFAARSGAAARAALRRESGIPSEATVVLFVGKLLEFKRPLDVVNAIARLRACGKPVEMLVAGSGPLESALRARAQELAVPLNVLGFVNQSRMPAVYAAADVLALPSTGRETWGLVANEALACGVPVVVSDAAGCAPDLCDGSAGLAHRCCDVSSLADELQTTLSRPVDKGAVERRSEAHSLARAADGIIAAAGAVQTNRRHW